MPFKWSDIGFTVGLIVVNLAILALAAWIVAHVIKAVLR